MAKTSRYQKERSKYQQPPTDAPCFYCGAKPAENCHLVDWLRLRRGGFPPRVLSQDWNLVPLCRPCHWLYDDRRNIWIGHQAKQSVGTIDGKENKVLTEFIEALHRNDIPARFPSDESEMGDVLPPHFGGMEDVDIIWGPNITVLQTKVGVVVVDGHLPPDDDGETYEPLWQQAMQKSGVYKSKEYREMKQQWAQSYDAEREKVMEQLKPKFDEAIGKAEQLANEHLRHHDLYIGDKPTERSEISGFDTTRLKDGVVRLFIWEE